MTWVTPRFEVSDHPEYSFCWGENWTTAVINAVMDSPMWKETAIFLTWDDYGGFYDRAAAAGRRLGFGIRAPMQVISPYAKHGHRATSRPSSLAGPVHRGQLGLSQLSERDRMATPLDSFDFDQRPRPPDLLPLPTDCIGEPFPDEEPRRYQ